MKRAVRVACRLIGPAVLLALLWSIGLEPLRSVLQRGRPAWLLAAAGLNLAIIFVKAWRWRRLMRAQSIHLGGAAAARHYAIGCALAAWTPGRLGDFSKAAAVLRHGQVGLGRAASSVIADRLLDAIVLGLVATAGAAALPGPRAIWIAAAGLSGAMIVAWALVGAATGAAGRLRDWVAGRWEDGAVRILGERLGRTLGAVGEESRAALDGLRQLRGRHLVLPVAATVLATGLTFAQGYLVARAMGLLVGFWPLSVTLAAVSITSLLPISIAGLGTREATLAILLAPAGVGLADILGFSLAYLVTVSGSLALIGLLAWLIGPAPKTRATT